MKTIIDLKIAAIIIALLFGALKITSAQQNRMNSSNQECQFNKLYAPLPDITEDQILKIKELRTNHFKKITELKNLLREKQAHHETLMTADNPDMSSINNNIDKISNINNKIIKERANHRQSVRKLLTEDQKIIFDQRYSRHRRNYGMRNRQKAHLPRNVINNGRKCNW